MWCLIMPSQKKSKEVIIDLKKLKDVVGSKNFLDKIRYLPVKCKACGHIDLIIKFIKIYNDPYNPFSFGSGSFASGKPLKLYIEEAITIDGRRYLNMLFCPKCDSSYVVADEDDLIVLAV